MERLNNLSEFPKRKHPNCKNPDCLICLYDHQHLERFFKQIFNYDTDWLSKYRNWLDDHHINSETNGWASKEAYHTDNIKQFILEQTK